MSENISYNKVDEKILDVRGEKVLLDKDVAELYGVEAKRVNEAVSNNPDKFPNGYFYTLSAEEWKALRSKYSTLDGHGRGQHTKYIPKAFTEKGLYMLATILKSPRATETTLAIVETFARLRELSRVINQLPNAEDKNQQNTLLRRSGEILAKLFDDDVLELTSDETTLELNFALMKVKHTAKREMKNKSAEQMKLQSALADKDAEIARLRTLLGKEP